MNKLSIENISKSYGKKEVLKNISMELEIGEIVGLFGPNGAGKTTCFGIIAGLISPDSGKLVLGQDDITKLPVHLRAKLGIGYLPQESSVFLGLSVEDNIRAILEIVEKDREVIKNKTENLLREFSINHLRDADSGRLSGGERRRLEIARCLASDPKFIMLDEPLAGIDPLAVSDVKKLVKHLKERDIGILITDHNVRDTLDVVDRAYIIYEGTVLTSGTPKEIIKNSKVKNVYLGDSFDFIE